MNLQSMELTNYWLPMVWISAAGIVLNMLPNKTERINGRLEERWTWFNVLVLTVPLVLWAGARGWIGDTAAYYRQFQDAPSTLSGLPAYLQSKAKDKGFGILMVLLKALGVTDSSVFFTIIAGLQMLGMVLIFRKYAPNFWVCIFLFVASTDYISWMFNGMRQFLATTIIFSASGLLFRRKLLQFFLVVWLASRIHGSALLMIPLALAMTGSILNKKVLLLCLGTVLLMPFSDYLTPVLSSFLEDTQYGDITTNEIWLADDGTNILRVLVYSVPALIAFFGRRYLVHSEDPVMNVCVNGAVITMALYLISSVTSGIYVGRLPIYTTFYGYMALPWLLERIFEEQTRRLLLMLMMVFYAVFYIYQMGTTWGLL